MHHGPYFSSNFYIAAKSAETVERRKKVAALDLTFKTTIFLK